MNNQIENEEHEVIGILFKCDPVKNKECKKTDCKICGNGQKLCDSTTNRNYAADGFENSPLIIRKPVSVIRIVDAQGKGMQCTEAWFADEDEQTVHGIDNDLFLKLYSLEEIERLIDKNFKIILYSPSLYIWLGNGMYNFNRVEMCFEREISVEKLDEMYEMSGDIKNS